jgi:Ni/Fe-hydrogenase subunit HybB-like protein
MASNVADDQILSEDIPVIGPGYDFATLTEKCASVTLTRPTPISWIITFLIAGGLVTILGFAVLVTFFVGVGKWGVDIPVAWGLAIVNFVWWIGIGHAGTLISAILLLLKQEWRNSINRFAEAMTLMAVMCAGMFPLLHLGRPWLAYWLFPYPNDMTIQPHFRSPLVWDVFAVSTYFTVSLVFWYIGMIPDLATLRDRAEKKWQAAIYGMLAMGWRGSARHWKRYESTYLLLAALATPLVLSVHTVVSFDFAIAQLPGWHTTIFPPYFVAGAIYSGFAMVIVLAIPIRSIYGLQDIITERHLRNSAKIMLATGMIVAYGYLMETFMSFYSGDVYEKFMMLNREMGPYAFWYWSLIATNIVIPQLLWFRKIRANNVILFLISLDILVGMWLERFIIVITSLHRDWVPSMWGMYIPTRWDWMIFSGTIGFFTLGFLLFVRALPLIPIFEVRQLLPQAEVHAE